MHMSFRSLTGAARPLALAALSVAIVGALVAPNVANASAFQLLANSATAMGRAYAGSATAGGDVSVVANNPAAMSDLDGTYLQADITAINFGTKFNGTATDALGRPISGNNGGNAGTTLPVPALYFATKVADGIHVGAAFDVPFGFKTDYNQDWVGRYNAIESKFTSLDTTLSASFDVNSDLSLGISAIAEKTTATLSNAINFNSVGLGLIQQAAAAGQISPAQAQALGAEVGAIVPPGTDGYGQLNGNNWAWGYQLAAEWKIDSQDKLAFNYRSKISHRLEGTANFSVPDNVVALLSNPAVAPLLGGGVPFTHTNGTAEFTNPATVSFSYWHQEEKWGLGADADWTQWDVFKNLTVNYANPAQPTTVQPFDWHNSWYVSFGGEYYLNDQLTLRAGVAIDTTPTTAQYREPRVPDESRKLASIGIGYKATEHFQLNASYEHVFVNNASINAAQSATLDTLTGYSEDYGNVLSLSAQYKF